MKLGCFYFIDDQYYIDFKDQNLMINKKGDDNKPHDRPCFYAIKEEKTNIFWMIPISSKVEKYREIYNRKVKKNKKCDTIIFGDVLGHEKAFLIQNMFPITEKYIQKEYLDSNTNEPIKINGRIKQELKRKSNLVLYLERKGIKIIFSDVLEIEKKLINMNNKEKSLENPVISELKTLQNEFKDEALKVGITSEDDVIKVLKENK